MRCWATGWLLGTLLLQSQSVLPPLWGLAILPVVALLLPWLSHRTRPSVAIFVVGMLLGFANSLIWAHHYLHDQLPASLEGQKLPIHGTVLTLPANSEDGSTALFRVDAATQAQLHIPAILRLSSSNQFGNQRLDWHPAERWQLTVKLKKPYSTYNPGVFDREAWLFSQHIGATGYVLSAQSRLTGHSWHPVARLHAFREHIRNRIENTLNHAPYAAIVLALTIGDQNNIRPEDWDLFRKTGITHLVSISGLHITMMAWLMSMITSWLWRRSARLCNWRPAQQTGIVAGMLAALGYTLISGGSVPAQRTLYMLLTVGLLRWQGLTILPAQLLATALWVVLLLDPFAAMSIGFWLSFGAVACLLWIGTGRLEPAGKWHVWLHSQWALFIGLLPGLAYLFGQVSLIAPIANAIAVPVVSFLVTPLALAGIVITPLLHIAEWLFEWLMKLLTLLATFSHAIWQIPSTTIVSMVLATVGAILLLSPKGWPGRPIGILMLLPACGLWSNRPAEGELHVAILDVGQGLAVHIQTRTHDLIYDTGPGMDETHNAGAYILVPYLQHQGIQQLSGVIVSHNDNDHSGGAVSLLKAMRSQWLLSSLPATHPAHALTPQSIACHAGQSWVWDHVRFDILSPDISALSDTTLKDNHKSCVLRVSSPYGRIIIPGDAEAPEETAMLQHYPAAALKSDILVAGHHGSKTSSSESWIRVVAPKEVIFTAGYRNRYRHPHPDIVERYIRQGSRYWISAKDGAIFADFRQGVPYHIDSQRALAGTYWHTGDDGRTTPEVIRGHFKRGPVQ
ncbi:DNA internalization-related competence protein ComEC/Rec2 [Leeia oryzae]|uniref:DNA internalization-related competence protein ComEC/Rec2 n=1 Tax=Leeia oryzae TaxID=356662 RepID=UPI000364B63A|nr:DNA internalization-related competence protein ComEC/Rec2 [Leeia oryzae]